MKDGQPLVSVVIIVFKQAELVGKTLDSVLSQTYRNLEIIVADDASPDNTPEVLQTYAKKHKNIKLLLNQQNGGITINMNRGLAAATGEFIAILGGDDLMHPDRIAKQVAALQAHPTAGLCHTNMRVFASATGQTLRLYHASQANIAALQTLSTLATANYVAAPSIMVRKSHMPAYGCDPSISLASDWIFALECGLRGIVYIPEVLTDYRIINTRVSNNSTRMLEDAEQTLNLIIRRYPTYTRAARAGLCRVNRAWAVYYFGQGKPRLAWRHLGKAMALGPLNITLWVTAGIGMVSSLESLWGGSLLTQTLVRKLRGTSHNA